MKHVIIGAGAAGMTAAKTIRTLRPEDEIVVISTDTKVHSRCMLHRFLSHERTAEELNFTAPDFFAANRITWMQGKTVSRLIPEEKAVMLEDGMRVSYDKLLLAPGAKSFIPPVGDLREAENVFGLRDLADAEAIDRMAGSAERILVIGSGLVGMDAAYAMLERGKKVTVVEMAERILPLQLDETAGSAYRMLFEQAGCKFYLGRRAQETVMNEKRRIETVILDDGTRLEADLLIVAAGVRAQISFAAGSGLETERFFETDEYLCTKDPDIYAAGDAAGLSGIWPNAMKQGDTAAYNMCGIPLKYEDTYAMKNTMNFYGLTTLSLGRGQVQEGDLVKKREDQRTYKKAIFRDHRLDSILLQGDIDYSGIYQYLIKTNRDLSGLEDKIFDLTFGDFYGITKEGKYEFS